MQAFIWEIILGNVVVGGVGWRSKTVKTMHPTKNVLEVRLLLGTTGVLFL